MTDSASSQPEQIQRAAAEILAWFMEHPDAKDTARGIHASWLSSDLPFDAVEHALGELVTRGWVRERPIHLAGPLYGFVTERRDDACGFLAGRGVELPDRRRG